MLFDFEIKTFGEECSMGVAADDDDDDDGITFDKLFNVDIDILRRFLISLYDISLFPSFALFALFALSLWFVIL